MRLAIVTSHPIQYQAPWFRALARVTDLEVFFCHEQDAAGQAEAGFGVGFDWDVPLLDGYRHHWLTNVSSRPGVSSFGGCDTPEIASRLAANSGFDACIVCGWYLKSYLQAIWGCKRAGIPVFARGDSQLAGVRSALWTLTKQLPYRWLLNTIDAHLYVGRANRDYLEHYGVPAHRLFFAPHFVASDYFAAGARRARESGAAAATRAAHQVPADAVVFLLAGKLIDKKRPADFVRAVQLAHAREPRVAGMVVGSGPLEREIRQLAGEGPAPIHFAGFQNQSQLPQHYAAADVMVLASDARETWGLVVNEAMSCGLPAIVSRACGCASDLVEEGRTGFTFSTGDVEALAAHMVRMATAPADVRSEWSAAAVAKTDHYSCANAVNGTVEALSTIRRPGPFGPGSRRPEKTRPTTG
jgi:glycosyltransferase involved in cell wall biosynthesis